MTAYGRLHHWQIKTKYSVRGFSTIFSIIWPEWRFSYHWCFRWSPIPRFTKPWFSLIQAGHCQTSIPDGTVIIFDGMTVLQELVIHTTFIKTCCCLSDFYVRAVDSKSRNYISAYVVFDDYSSSNFMKDATHARRTSGKTKYHKRHKVYDTTCIKTNSHKRHRVDDTTCIGGFRDILSTAFTKDQLTLYRTKKITNTSQSPVVNVTRAGDTHLYQSASEDLGDNHEKANTKMVLVHIYSSNADVLVLALSVFLHLE